MWQARTTRAHRRQEYRQSCLLWWQLCACVMGISHCLHAVQPQASHLRLHPSELQALTWCFRVAVRGWSLQSSGGLPPRAGLSVDPGLGQIQVPATLGEAAVWCCEVSAARADSIAPARACQAPWSATSWVLSSPQTAGPPHARVPGALQLLLCSLHHALQGCSCMQGAGRTRRLARMQRAWMLGQAHGGCSTKQVLTGRLQVPLSLLWQAMQPFDPVTGKSRGWLEIRADRDRSSIMFVLDTDSRSVKAFSSCHVLHEHKQCIHT